MTEYQVNGISFLAADGFRAAGGIAHGFSTRLGGVSDGIFASLNLGTNRGDDPARVQENYRRFCTAIGADADRVIPSGQVHGDVIRTATANDIKSDLSHPTAYQCDGLITDQRNLVLTVYTADCIPILLYDPVRRVIAAIHAGWRGTALDIAGKAVQTMHHTYGCRPETVLAAIGPGISACCFETHADVPDAMISALGSLAKNHVLPLGNGKFRVDLKGINAALLSRSGLSFDHIDVSADCTSCLHEKYWSHRVTQGQRGSQAAMIQLL